MGKDKSRNKNVDVYKEGSCVESRGMCSDAPALKCNTFFLVTTSLHTGSS